MTAYATCAKVGCNEKIRYDENSTTRPRYCNDHLREMSRGGKLDEWMYIRVKPTLQSMQEEIEKPKMVVLLCPICKKREIVRESIKGYNQTCFCGAKMIYHKDVGCDQDVR